MKASLTLLIPLLASLAAPAEAQGQQQNGAAGSQPARQPVTRVPGQSVLRTLPGVDAYALAEGAGGAVIGQVDSTTYLLQLPPGSSASGVAGNPGAVWLEPNFFLTSPETGTCGTTGGIGSQGGCTIAFYDGNPAPESYYDQPTTSIIEVQTAQDLSLGTPSIVAVIDTGVDASHMVLAGRVLMTGYDFVDEDSTPWDEGNGLDDDRDGLVDEALGHGTHVSGIIALINPDALILPFRVLDSDGNGTAFDVALAIHAAVDQGADVINLSLGMSAFSKVVRDAILRADEADVTVVASAGNTASRVLFPARVNDVVAVAALHADDTKADFSSFGMAVEVSAPGVEIYSAMPGNAWAWWSGTSMSAAVVSGATSLLHSVHGDPSEAEGSKALERTSVDIDDVNYEYHELLGDGRIDVAAAAQWLLANPD